MWAMYILLAAVEPGYASLPSDYDPETAEYMNLPCTTLNSPETCTVSEVSSLRKTPAFNELQYVRNKEGRLIYFAGACSRKLPCDVSIQTLR